MYDCFNMAYQDNAVQLHIQVNSENLLSVPQKYNAGSLRIPADPSWPKIPQRKLASEIDDAIESPCIITLTGTPRKSRTIVQTPVNQSPKSVRTKDSAYSSFCHQRTTSSMHTLKRLPGYVDPRFKKVTNVTKNKDTSTSTEHLHNKEAKKSVPERDIDTRQMEKQEAEKPHENDKFDSNRQPTLEQQQCPNTIESENQDNTSENVNKSKIIDKCKCMKSSSEYRLRSTVNDADTQVDITLPVQENNGQLFFVLDKKLQANPLNAIHIDTITIPQEYVKQCYNVQVPVLTYQNIPLQVSAAGTNVIPQCLNKSEQESQNKKSEPSSRSTNVELSNQFIQTSLGQIQQMEKSCITNEEKEDMQDSKRKNTLNIQDANCLENPNIPEKLENIRIQQKQQESSDSEYYVPNVHTKSKYTNALRKSITCNTSGEETTDSEFILRKGVHKKDFLNNKLITKGARMNTDTIQGDVKVSVENQDQMNVVLKEPNKNQPLHNVYKKVIPEAKTRNKSEQNLLCIRNDCSRKLCHNSEPHITFKQKKVSAKFSRKARSYFQKNSHSALVDSDYTLMWPHCQHSKYKRIQTNSHRSNHHKTKRIDQQIIDTTNSNEHNYVENNGNMDSSQEVAKSLSKTCLQKECCKCEMSPRSNTDDTIEKPKGIPPKTQELLNKSYWEFYNKLRHKIKDTSNIEQQYPYQLTMDASEKITKRKSNEAYNKELRNQLKLNPELQTLQQCSALSSMINKALDTNLQSDIMQTKQLYVNDNMKSSSNPTGCMQNVNIKKMVSSLNNDDPMLNKIKCRTSNIHDKQFLELKSIIFFGGMMYILIIFLPMLYDYFYHQDYNDYENLSYLELIVEYVLSSFKEAFGDIFNGVKQIFFYLHSCKKCTNTP
ncbi:uncharacterized protein LOC117610086 isoform X1 [Osmia lignaria lignaria]|uniref:uncharacterized protein LOC117610086 isoform X1 n=1 Tax=Osmia lignaria lignaria TaxID=1437193 RepID=UPI00402BDFBD